MEEVAVFQEILLKCYFSLVVDKCGLKDFREQLVYWPDEGIPRGLRLSQTLGAFMVRALKAGPVIKQEMSGSCPVGDRSPEEGLVLGKRHPD